jgi:hypothetical protein
MTKPLLTLVILIQVFSIQAFAGHRSASSPGGECEECKALNIESAV